MRSMLVIVLTLVLSVCSLAQVLKSTPDAQKTLATRGLVLTLTRDQTTESSDSPALKSCLEHHPSLACIPLAVALKNEGEQTVLLLFSSCDGGVPGIEIQMPNGDWEAFPHEPIVCTRNVLVLRSLAHGESYVLHFRLGDPLMSLDTTFPPDDGLIHLHDQYRSLLGGTGPRAIRAYWNFDGCIASEKFKSDVGVDPYAPGLCSEGTDPIPQFAVVRSNELILRIDSGATSGLGTVGK